jgi:hypothetical protein
VNLSRTVRLVGRRLILVGGIFLAAVCATHEARAQLAYPPSPCSVLSAKRCHPAVCSTFHHGPCFPDYGAPIGERLRMTVAASEENGHDKTPEDRSDEAQLVNSLHDMFVAIRGCWEPPPPDKARPGMEYTIMFAFKRNGELMAPARMTYATHDVPEEVRDAYRDAIDATLKRCTPMHFSTGMAGAVAGRPLLVRFFDDRIMIENFKGGDSSGK